MSSRKAGFLLVSGALIILALAPAAQATVYTWNGGNGKWSVAGNWSPPGGPPNNFDTAIIPTGTVTLDALYSVKNLTLGAGATLNITKWSLNFVTDDPAKTCLVTNDGRIELNATGSDTAALNATGNVVTLTGSGEVVLGGLNNLMGNGGGGGSFINDTGHTIRGGGYIQAGITNKNQIIADNGPLYLQAPFVNTGGAIRVDGATSEIILNGSITGGGLYPQDGKVTVNNSDLVNMTVGPGMFDVAIGSRFKGNVTLESGTVFLADSVNFDNAADGTPPTFTNNTVITGGRYTAVKPATLTGNGRIVIGTGYIDGGDAGTAGLTQGPNHTVEGPGLLRGHIINNGKIKAINGLLEITNYLINNGTLELADSTILQIYQMTTVNLSLPLLSSFLCGVLLEIKGNFAFAQKDVTKVTWGDYSTLRLSGGGPWQSLEVGGKDFGADWQGATNNFAINKFRLEGSGTRVYLVDNIDNGHRSPGVREALYIKQTGSLTVLPGATLNLNGIHLYTYFLEYGTIGQVHAGDGPKFGGGQIIDVPQDGYRSISVLSLLLD